MKTDATDFGPKDRTPSSAVCADPRLPARPCARRHALVHAGGQRWLGPRRRAGRRRRLTGSRPTTSRRRAPTSRPTRRRPLSPRSPPSAGEACWPRNAPSPGCRGALARSRTPRSGRPRTGRWSSRRSCVGRSTARGRTPTRGSQSLLSTLTGPASARSPRHARQAGRRRGDALHARRLQRHRRLGTATINAARFIANGTFNHH